MKKRKKSFEEMMKPFCLVRPRDEIGGEKVRSGVLRKLPNLCVSQTAPKRQTLRIS